MCSSTTLLRVAQVVSLGTEGVVAQARTIGRLWLDGVAANRATPAYLVERDDGWQPVSWQDSAQAVDELANGLLASGVRKGNAVAIVGQTKLEWALFDFALALIGAIAAPVYANSSPKDAQYVVTHSEAVAALCEDDEQRAKIESLGLPHVWTFTELSELREQGRRHASGHPDALREAAAAVSADDLFTYMYTSGTTGPPKACMIRHSNYYEMVAVVDQLEDFTSAEDVLLLYLPLAHNFGRLMHLAGPYVGYTIAFLPDPLRTAEALLQVRPTVLPSVPRVYEKVHTAVRAKFDEETGVKRRIVDWALRVGARVSVLRQHGKPVPAGLELQRRLADRLVYAKVRERLGNRLRIAISGGAPLAKEIAEFFDALGITILEGYGLTECTSAATVNQATRYRLGTVGPALPGTELRLADDGELLIRSPTVFAGYLKDEAATREMLDGDGWLHSGDIAEIDDEGFVTITDRKKDILVTAGGKNVAPANLENDLKAYAEISHALVIGDRRPFVAALVTLDPDVTAALSDEQKHARVREIVDAVNRDRSRFEQIKRFAILPRDFSMDEGEVTPTLKLKRRVVLDHFASEVETIYS
jgi:long-chain acyl-CoA synthetase